MCIRDRDKVVPFDNIIEQAEKRDIHVGWSNPCIELWFSAYFGEMPTFAGSPQCVSHFKKLFEQKTGTEYTKAIAEIYKKLNNNGDENNAIRIAKTQHKNMVNSCSKPVSYTHLALGGIAGRDRSQERIQCLRKHRCGQKER